MSRDMPFPQLLFFLCLLKVVDQTIHKIGNSRETPAVKSFMVMHFCFISLDDQWIKSNLCFLSVPLDLLNSPLNFGLNTCTYDLGSLVAGIPARGLPDIISTMDGERGVMEKQK